MIPEKAQTETWTDAQWQAIWQHGSDTLVSAAAGSGKTAVLIRRLIEKIIRKNDPVNVDELLVVTFTNAAAAEMRHRLGDALEKALLEDPDSKHLRKQLHLLNKASISTLHSFCLQVIRQHGYLLDIDPGFRLANENEAALLQEDALEEIIEEAYEMDQERMYRLADSFSSDRSDLALEHLIRQLYKYARVHPNPDDWLSRVAAQYALTETTAVDDLPYTEQVKKSILYRVQTALSQVQLMESLARSGSGLDALEQTAALDRQLLSAAEECVTSGTWQDLYDFFSHFKWPTAKAVRGDHDEGVKQQAQAIRNQYKTQLVDIKEDYFMRRPERLLDEIRFMHPIIETLVSRVNEFSARYEEKKAERSLLDFSDLEHKAFAILSDERAPSDIALSYRRKFKEVLVDEYQDINLLQESIIQRVKSGDDATGNLFMVGDVKQSIYRFRLAEPMLFLGKYQDYKTTTQSGEAIDLNANFRSRKQVLSGINYIFEQIMGEDVGEIAYDEDASLKPGAPYPDSDVAIDVHILQKDVEGEDLSKARAEAEWVATKIQTLLASGAEVTDPWTGKTRLAEYRDFVVLMRSMTWTGDFSDVFKKHHIPLYVEMKTGFYDALEVIWMMELLKVIDNPMQDIPLVAVLRSPMIGLNDEELATLRTFDKKCSYYDLIMNRHALQGLPQATREKVQHFVVLLNAWQKKSQSGPLSDLIWSIYQDVYLLEQVATMPNGSQRVSNLHLFLDQAEQFEKTSYRGVFRFLRFIERIRSRGDDVGEAKAISDRENVVRIMTIHASKGLEFPYVFLPGMARGFNRMDFNENYLFDQHYGIAVKAIDPDLRIAYHSLPYNALKETKELQANAEEMRILYVAMTRAREKLFMVLTVPDVDAAVEKWGTASYVPATAPVPPFMRSNAKSYWDWLGPAWMRLPEFQQLLGLLPSAIKPLPGVFHFELEIMEEKEVAEFEQVKQFDQMSVQNASLPNFYLEPYPFEVATKKAAKQTVSELKRVQLYEASNEDFFASPPSAFQEEEWEVPSFMERGSSISATSRGTIYHSVFQHIPISQSVNIPNFLNELVQREILTEEEKQLVRVKDIDAFLQSELMQELLAANQYYREQPFTYAYQDDAGNHQIIQGVIDLFFQDKNDNWHLIDFKTDALVELRNQPDKIAQELRNRYSVQMTIYGNALEDILAIKLASKRIYSVTYREIVDI